MIDIKQFDGKMVTPKDDALLYDFVINQTGIFEGCTVTHLGANQIKIADGRGIIKGRNFVVSEETILATLSDSGTKKGRLIIRVDSANAENPISFVTQMAATLPALVQEDINRGGNVYELPIATYDVTEVLISSLVMVATVVTPLPRTPTEIGAAPVNHNHDGRYATAAQGANADNALPKSGGTMTGQLTAQYNANYSIAQARNINLLPVGSGLAGVSNGGIVMLYK